jgi:hypothetical protein
MHFLSLVVGHARDLVLLIPAGQDRLGPGFRAVISAATGAATATTSTAASATSGASTASATGAVASPISFRGARLGTRYLLEGPFGGFAYLFDSGCSSINGGVEVVHNERVASDEHDSRIEPCSVNAIEEAANFVVLTQGRSG